MSEIDVPIPAPEEMIKFCALLICLGDMYPASTVISFLMIITASCRRACLANIPVRNILPTAVTNIVIFECCVWVQLLLLSLFLTSSTASLKLIFILGQLGSHSNTPLGPFRLQALHIHC